MKVQIIASTKPGYILPIDKATIFSGQEAGICYMPDTIETLLAQPEEKATKRANNTKISGHHSVFGHVYYSFTFEEIPKILAMILNNEKVYQTSEKSARYTKMKTTEEEQALYEKWIEIYKNKIHETYPNIDEKKVQKLAQENARYLISIFTPATTMGYTVDLRQISYILNWMKNFEENSKNNKFTAKLKPVFSEFREQLKNFEIDGLTDGKGRSLSLFATRQRPEEWGENYCTNYKATFAQLAQAQRHRTIKYEISFLDEPEFFIPPIIQNTPLEAEWLEDIKSLAENFPQGMLINVNERGSYEDFILKCKERLCGCAQLEIAVQTKETMDKYLQNTKNTNPEVYKELLPYSSGARCTFKDYKCTSPCIWGAKFGLDRKI